MSYPFSTFPLVNRVGLTTPAANVDARYGPWLSLNQALTAFNTGLRFRGLTLGVYTPNENINSPVVEYWYRDGVADNNLILKTTGTGGGGTDLATVTNYLSTSNVLISGLTVTGNLSTQSFGTAKDWSYKQDFIGTLALTSTTFLELLANRNYIQYELSANLVNFSRPHGTVVVNNKIYLSSHLGSGTNGQIVVINEPFGDLTNQTLITLPNETAIPALCYHKQTDRIYGVVASNTGDKIIRFNPNNNTYDTFYTFSGNEATPNSCVINDNEHLYVGTFSKVFRIRISDATLINTYQSGFTLGDVHSIQISPDGQYILCTNLSDFFRINIQTGVINQINFGHTFTDDNIVLGDYFYCLSEESGGQAYKINWKDLTFRLLYTQRPGWCISTDGRFVYFLHNYVGAPGGIPTPTNVANIYKYDPDNESWHTVYLATTIPLFNVANLINEIFFVEDKVFLTNYNSGSDKIFRAQIKTEVTTVPVLRDERNNWDIDAPPVYNLYANRVFAGSGDSNQWNAASTYVQSNSASFPQQTLLLPDNLPSGSLNIINPNNHGIVYQTVSADQVYFSLVGPGRTFTLFISGNHESLKRHTIILNPLAPPGTTNLFIAGAGQSNNFYTFKNHVTKVTLINPLTSTFGIGTAEVIRTDLNVGQGGLGFLLQEDNDRLLQENGDRLVIRNFT